MEAVEAPSRPLKHRKQGQNNELGEVSWRPITKRLEHAEALNLYPVGNGAALRALKLGKDVGV